MTYPRRDSFLTVANPDRAGTDALPRPPEWVASASCAGVDPGIWFPEIGENTRQAKAICRGCDVLNECREWILDYEAEHPHEPRYGVYGGLSVNDRKRLTRPETMRHTPTCGHCGRVFRSDKRETRTCSPECFSAYVSARSRAQRAAERAARAAS